MGNDDDLSLSSSASTISSTVTKFYGFGGTVVVRVFDRVSGFERPNVVDLISDNENNDNDNDTHQSAISISSSISSSSVQIVEGPVISVPFVSPDTKPIYHKLLGWTTGTDSDKFPSTMVKSKKTQPTDEEAFQAIESSVAPLPTRQRKKPSQFCPSNGNNDNNDNNKNKKPKAKIVKKKKKILSSTLTAISKSVTSKKDPPPLRPTSRSPIITETDDESEVSVEEVSLPLPLMPLPASLPCPSIASEVPPSDPASVSMFAPENLPHKDMGFADCADDKTVSIAEFLQRVEKIPGGIYGDDTEMIKNLSSNTTGYEKAKFKVRFNCLYPFILIYYISLLTSIFVLSFVCLNYRSKPNYLLLLTTMIR